MMIGAKGQPTLVIPFQLDHNVSKFLTFSFCLLACSKLPQDNFLISGWIFSYPFHMVSASVWGGALRSESWGWLCGRQNWKLLILMWYAWSLHWFPYWLFAHVPSGWSRLHASGSERLASRWKGFCYWCFVLFKNKEAPSCGKDHRSPPHSRVPLPPTPNPEQQEMTGCWFY